MESLAIRATGAWDFVGFRQSCQSLFCSAVSLRPFCATLEIQPGGRARVLISRLVSFSCLQRQEESVHSGTADCIDPSSDGADLRYGR